jgi:hypothetical protein
MALEFAPEYMIPSEMAEGEKTMKKGENAE